MVILRTRNKITDFFMILAWASPFKQTRYIDPILVQFCPNTEPTLVQYIVLVGLPVVHHIT